MRYLLASALGACGMLAALGDLAPAQAPTVAREVARIGDGERTDFGFGRVTGLAIDARGYVYVADGQDHRVAVFDTAGRHVTTFGRHGKGPGEFEYPTSIAVAADGTVLVRDAERVQRFRVDRPGGPATTYAAVVGQLTMTDWTSTRTGVVDRAGYTHVPVSYSRTRGPQPGPVAMMLRLDAQGQRVDSLLVPAYANAPMSSAWVRLSESGGRMLRGLSHVPFAAIPVWASSPAGTIISGDGLTYELRETDATGAVLRRFSRPHTPVAIDAAERRDSLRALGVRLDSLTVPLSQVEGMPDEVRQRRLPAHYPPYREVIVAAGGDVWVRRWTSASERGRSLFDVFGGDGAFRGRVALPADVAAGPSLVVRDGWAAAVVTDPDTGLQAVVRFVLPAH